MSDSERSDTDRLAELVAEAQRADLAARDAYESIEPQSAASRDARSAVMWEAARIVINDTSQAAEVATLVFDGRLGSLDYLARGIGNAIEWRLRDIFREMGSDVG